MQIHDSVKEYAEQKAKKLERFSEDIQRVEIVMSTQGDSKVVEMIAIPRKGQDRVVGQSEHEDQYAALDLLIDKMVKQLRKQSDKRNKGRKRSGRVPPPPEPSDLEEDERLETYDEVVDKFSEQLDT
jgi:putative sigma-54 modulation protein